ncbi:DNA-binding response regulator [Marinobacter sp. R17]|uniref:response regulator n=1 Tax=Marinobacter sp. R17 TaxID=2484250 RepID=UPI000F4CD837|nr:response regulator transcription factor [Marinobacter sp. R17]ROU00824.1 DNA-binding response regulator [Marinobacter sp. R17]
MRLLLVDDHVVVRQGIANLLRTLVRGCELDEVETGQEAVRRYGESRPDVVLLDLSLPDISGLEVARRLRSRWPSARVLFFTMHDELPLVRQALDLGALGFLTKNCAPEELARGVRDVAEGRAYLEHRLATRMAMNQDDNVDRRLRDMTQRELEVLLMYARGEDISGIASKLCISNKTVSNHLALLKSKLRVSSAIELVHLAVDAGLVRYGQARVY